jgi:hypothetical protein
MNYDPKEHLTIHELAQVLGLRTHSLREKIRKGRLRLPPAITSVSFQGRQPVKLWRRKELPKLLAELKRGGFDAREDGEYITLHELARLVNLNPAAVKARVKVGKLPPHDKLAHGPGGPTKLWKRAAILEYLKTRYPTPPKRRTHE